MDAGQFANRSCRVVNLAIAWAVIASISFLAGEPEASAQIGSDPLPSWNETAAKKAIVNFVGRTTTDGSSEFVPLAERIATFDNDGTLWCEQPAYVQLEFVFARIQAMADQHPEWKTQEPFASVLKGDKKGLADSGEKGLLELVAVTHSGMTVEEFNRSVSDWLDVARHPKTHRPYTQMVYQPMLELLRFLRSNGYKTYIVSGGGVEFMRPWTEKIYGIPPEQVVGSYGQLQYEMREGKPVLRKLAKVGLVDDKQGKPVGIQTFIGRRPVMAFGNSDGDLEMLEWTTSGGGPRFGLIVHHTDAEREYAYDRNSPFGRLDKALDSARSKKWIVVDIKDDWNVIFPDK